MEKIEYLSHNDVNYAIIIRNEFKAAGIHFFTQNEYSQQLGYMNHSKGHIINPHVHTNVERIVHFTKEVLFIKSGKIRADFYKDDQSYLFSTILLAGDVILLAYGGHGFEILEDSEIIEVKQGPYVGENDKVRFIQETDISKKLI
jgi:hypothetical protein